MSAISIGVTERRLSGSSNEAAVRRTWWKQQLLSEKALNHVTDLLRGVEQMPIVKVRVARS